MGNGIHGKHSSKERTIQLITRESCDKIYAQFLGIFVVFYLKPPKRCIQHLTLCQDLNGRQTQHIFGILSVSGRRDHDWNP